MRIFTLEQGKVSSILDFTFYSICALFLALSLLINGSRHYLVGILLLILVGLFSWTAIEYLLHRFILHGLQPFKNWHIEHHKHPGDLLCLPTLLSAALVLILVFFACFVYVWNIACLRTDFRCSHWIFGLYNHPSWDSSLAHGW